MGISAFPQCFLVQWVHPITWTPSLTSSPLWTHIFFKKDISYSYLSKKKKKKLHLLNLSKAPTSLCIYYSYLSALFLIWTAATAIQLIPCILSCAIQWSLQTQSSRVLYHASFCWLTVAPYGLKSLIYLWPFPLLRSCHISLLWFCKNSSILLIACSIYYQWL